MNTIENKLTIFAKNLEPILLNTLQPRNKESEEIINAMQYAVLAGGKKFRPFLLYSLGKVFNLQDDILLKVGSSIELMHAYSLVHDDLPAMDNDDERRGKPTVHKKFSESTAILVGDALQSQAFLILSDEKLDITSSIKIQLVNMLAFYSGTYNLISGQMLDLAFKESSNTAKDIEQLLTINLLKTAKMFGVCGAFVAKLAKIHPALESQIIYYCETLGILWQIVDDFNDAIIKPNETANIVLLAKKDEATKMLENYKNKAIKLASNIVAYIKAQNINNIDADIFTDLVNYIYSQIINDNIKQ